MSWLAPWFLLSGFAISLPIAFHMLRRTPRGTLPFSTLMFLQPSPPRITRRSRIEHWLLLVLRGLALLMLAIAFSRPFWRNESFAPEKPQAGKLIAILLDTSASLRRDGLWADLQLQLTKKLRTLGPHDRVALFHFADALSTDVSFEQTKSLAIPDLQQLVREQATQLTAGWGGSHLGTALVEVAQRLQTEQEQATPSPAAELWLFSDLQAGADVAALQGYDWPTSLLVDLTIVISPQPSNAGLQLVESTEDSSMDALRVRITNAAESKRDEFTITAHATKPASSQPDSKPTSTSVTAHVPPGESRVIAVPKLSAGMTLERIVLTGDEHPFDNMLWVVPPTITPRTVVYFGSESADDIRQPRFYLERVFAGDGRQPVRLLAVSPVDSTTTSEVKADDHWFLPGVQVPALAILTSAAPDQSARLQAYAQQGGTILVAAASAEHLSACLTPWNEAPFKVGEATVARYAILSEINFQHPLFASFAEARFADFTGIHFWKHRKVDLPATSPWKVLARFDDGDPAVLELPVGKGRVVVLTSGWHPIDSQLARSSKFAPLLFQLQSAIGGEATRPLAYRVGQPVPLPETSASISITHNSESRALPTGHAEFTDAVEPGLYAISYGDRGETIAVNLSPEESRTTPIPREQLESLGVRLTRADAPAEAARKTARERQRKIVELEQQQQIWRWLIVVVLGVIITETWLASRTQAASLATPLESAPG